MRKKLKWIALGFVLLLILVIGVVWWNLNSIVRVAVEKGTGRSLALNTTLGKANVQLLSGDVSLGDLSIGNPEGFKEPTLLTLGGVSVDTSYGKLFDKPATTINAITIDRPKLTIEFQGTESNLKAVADNLMKTQQGQPGPQPSPTPPPNPQPQPNPQPGDANKPLKLIIDQLDVTGAQVEIVSDLLGVRQTIDIPAVHLQAIGNADGNRNGEEIGKVVSQVIAALTLEAQKSGKLPPQLATILNGDVDQLVNQIGGRFKEQIGQLQQEAVAQVQQMGQQASQQVQQVRTQAEQQINATTQRATDELQQRLGGILGGNNNDRREANEDRKPTTRRSR